MPHLKEGDRVRVVTRAVTEEDRKKNRYYQHMAGLVGTVQQAYNADEIAIQVEPSSMGKVSREVHETATQRMRDHFVSQISEEQRKQLTKEELNFDAHYVLLLREADLESI